MCFNYTNRADKEIRRSIGFRATISSISLVFLVCSICTATSPVYAEYKDSQPSPKDNKISSDSIEFLDQGWDPALREKYYYTPQGSRFMPYNWFMALENASDQKPFATADNLARFGWLKPTQENSSLNPGRLPVGFAIDPVDVEGSGRWIGLTCAACHTNDLVYKGKRLRIDGAPALADFGAFMEALANAVNATLLNEDKFKRFALKVLGSKANDKTIASLHERFLNFTTTLIGRVWMRTPPIPAGAGRVDALNQIINALSVFDLQVPDNLRPPGAPVNYPFLWYTPKLAWVQWNPIASNPLSRNAGEVMGVFGHAQLTGEHHQKKTAKQKIKVQRSLKQLAKDLIPADMLSDKAAKSIDTKAADISNVGLKTGKDQFPELFTSSVLFKNLNDLESWLRDLKSPRWNDNLFGPIDEKLARKGAVLFKKHCRDCHNMPPFDMTPKEDNIVGKQFIKIGRINYKDVGTDTAYIESLLTRFTKTGQLSSVLFEDKKVVPAGVFFLGTVGAIVEKGLTDMKLSDEQRLEYADYRYYPPSSPNEKPKPYRPPALDDLKAGPLLGIWSTGPFLHNGSVPNIYELLSPPEKRSKVFWVGSLEFDAKKLGFDSRERDGLFRFDTRLPGNGNQGHVYPAKPYTHKQKMALIEYLKDPYRYVKE